MINETNLTQMYEGIINNQELTRKLLNNCSFNSKDITDLMNNGTLERVKRGYYSLNSINDLYYYGKKLISMKEYDKANACFEKCHELNPKHTGVCFQLFLRCIQNKDYEKAMEYFDYIYETDNKFYNADNDYFLYLLSMVTELPSEHKQYAKYLKFEDIRIDFDDKRYNDISVRNKARISAFNQKFTLALKQFNDLINQNDRISIQDIITKTLLIQAIEKQSETKKNIIKLLNEKRYEEVIEYLDKIQEFHNLSITNEYIKILINELIEIQKTGIIPDKKVFITDKVFDAIHGKNYELALELCTKSNDNAIYILLKEIQNLINKNKNPHIVEESTNLETNQAIEIKSQDKHCINTFADVIGYLLENDLPNAFVSLRKYLNNIDKIQYEFLIIDLIKISLLENDINFTKPMKVLTYITKNIFKFNISEYLISFYDNLAQHNFDKARIYLDILSKSSNLGQDCVLIKDLDQVLNNTESEYRQNSRILIESLQNINEPKITQQEDEYDNNTPVNEVECEENYYGIKNIEQIAELVASGVPIEDACLSMNLNNEQKNIVILIFAREYYAQEYYSIGDTYLNKVEKENNKSQTVKNLLKEIRKNKRFYKNRENQKRLTLTSKNSTK